MNPDADGFLFIALGGGIVLWSLGLEIPTLVLVAVCVLALSLWAGTEW